MKRVMILLVMAALMMSVHADGIDQEVESQLASNGTAAVIVLLHEEPIHDSAERNLMMQEKKEDVLANLDVSEDESADIKLTREFSTGFAGEVTEEGLEKLR